MARRDFPNRSEPGRSSSRRSRDPQEPSFARRWLRRLLVWGMALTLLGAMALAVAVFVTERSLPS